MDESRGGTVVSQPKRYSIRGFSAALVEEENGVMVKWEDYAALENHTEALEMIIKAYRQGEDAIQAENYRLRKALDDIEAAWESKQAMEIVRIISAAKGGQS
jgi:uncharacterized protein YjcR